MGRDIKFAIDSAGVMVIGEINHTTAHVMNILWLVGTFTFAIVLGVVTEDIVNHVIVSLGHTAAPCSEPDMLVIRAFLCYNAVAALLCLR